MSTHTSKADSFYAELGGEPALRELEELFHDIVEVDLEAEPLKNSTSG